MDLIDYTSFQVATRVGTAVEAEIQRVVSILNRNFSKIFKKNEKKIRSNLIIF